jgi:methanogenic corrinoid protein MtbC1
VTREETLAGLEKSVVSGNKVEAIKNAHAALKVGVKALDAIDNGLVKGMTIVGDKYAVHEMYLPQVLLAADAMYGALDVLLPHLPVESAKKMVGVTIGVVEGDVHDIGKNLVKTMLTAAGFAVTDLGRDVPIDNFITVTKDKNAAIVAMVIDGLVEAGLRMKVKTIIGGAPCSQEFAESIGSDFFGLNAQDAVEKLKGAM